MFLAVTFVATAWAQPMGRPGLTARYVHQNTAALRASVVKTFTLSLGPLERKDGKDYQWLSVHAAKANGDEFRFWLLSAGYPPSTLQAARTATARYLVQEGSSPIREYRNPLTEDAVVPQQGGFQYLIPRPVADSAAEILPKDVAYLGHKYVRESLAEDPPARPPTAEVVGLRPDLLIGPATNSRAKDEIRRYDESDYEMIRLTRQEYREMAAVGINCVSADAEQMGWADELKMFYWGAAAKLPYPEFLYRSQYLGPALYLDEPAVTTRDYVLRPRLAKDPAFRKAISPQAAFDAFREHFDHVMKQGAPTALTRALAARPDVDVGNMRFAQENLYTWETMVSTAAHQLTQDPLVPAAMVFEPPGRIGTRRTIPEINMTYGTQIPADDPRALSSLIFGFLRGAARLTGKSWGVSIYGSVQRPDSFWWLTHAYDLGATRFHFWDNYRLACVPYSEYMALTRHLRGHANQNPQRDLERLRRAAEVVILLPPGYNLGHVQFGKGSLWGIGELNLERTNQKGVKYRAVMSNFFAEIERCLRLGIAFDLLWDLPGIAPKGYSELVRIREDGKVEVREGGRSAVLDRGRQVALPPGVPPQLSVSVAAKSAGAALEVKAQASVVEKSAPVYYTLGADTEGTYHNAMVAWELYGPGEEDYRYPQPEKLKPRVRRTASGAEMEVDFKLEQPGQYRLRAATVDLAGRTTVVWRKLEVSAEAPGGRLSLR